MGDQFFGAASLSIPDRRVLMQPAHDKDKIVVLSDSTNVDAGGPRTTMLRPGNVLIAGASDSQWFDDTSGGQASAVASITGTVSDASSNAGFGKTLKWTVNGGVEQTVTMGSTTASHDTNAEIVSTLNASALFAADLIADESGNFVRIRAKRIGDYFTVTAGTINAVLGFTDNTIVRPTEADYVVTVEYCDQLDALGTAADARVAAVRAGIFDLSNLVYAGAALTSGAIYADFRRVMEKRGSRFE